MAATGSTWVIKLITELVELLMKNDYRGAIFGGGQGREDDDFSRWLGFVARS